MAVGALQAGPVQNIQVLKVILASPDFFSYPLSQVKDRALISAPSKGRVLCNSSIHSVKKFSTDSVTLAVFNFFSLVVTIKMDFRHSQWVKRNGDRCRGALTAPSSLATQNVVPGPAMHPLGVC